MVMRLQMMQTMHQHMQQAPVAHAPPPRDCRVDFLRGNPPTFIYSSDPIPADDWLRVVERELDVAQCTDQERVLYGSR
jgi:hypothetical protein